MTRLETLKKELAEIENMWCMSYDLREQCKEYYEHEIECIEKWGSPNPEYGEKR